MVGEVGVHLHEQFGALGQGVVKAGAVGAAQTRLAGAMENLGAITFRETALLADAQTASRAELERVADVVSHENAHMWFGDLVTMKWWDDLWLNEAFATWMATKSTMNVHTEWEEWKNYSSDRNHAMHTDSLKATRLSLINL